MRARLADGRRPFDDKFRQLSTVTAEHHEALADEIGLAMGRAYARVFDELLEELFAGALTAAGSAVEGIALAGVGGYGRAAVALGSDLDMRLLTADLDQARKVADALLYPLWDSGLSLGHQVLTIRDVLTAAAEDLPTATSLLDWRFVAGDRRLNDALLAESADGIFSLSEMPRFLERLDCSLAQRHRRFGGSVYLLEPNVKNGPGGLRDLDVAWWAARARWHVSAFDDLLRIGVLVGRQLRAVRAARELLWRIRNLLHQRAGRRQDRLGFDEQEGIAALLGYDGDSRDATERMMSDYYRAARTISRFRDMMLALAAPVLIRRRHATIELGGGAQLFAGAVTLAESALLEREPIVALRLVDKAIAQRVPIRRSTRTAIINVCGDSAWAGRLREDPEAAQLFVELVQCCRETRLKQRSVVHELHDLGLLLAMIPEFGPVVGRVHYDTYHVYTVDVHSVMATARLAEIVRGDIALDEDEEERWAGSLACQVASDISRPAVLFFATLLHDVGKAIGRMDHSERGAEMASAIVTRLGFLPADAADVGRLIEHHLTMYHVATRRDIDDPATIDEMAHAVRGREGLRNLYLLTVADLSTTSPTSMTSWKARMLDELYLATDVHLTSGGAKEGSLLERRRNEAERLVSGEDWKFLREFLSGMPDRYLLATPAPRLVSHAQLVRTHLDQGNQEVSLGVVCSDLPGGSELCVVAADRSGLLADIAAAIAAAKLEVHAAQIHSCHFDVKEGGSVAVDVFWIQHAVEGAPGVARALPKLKRDLCALLRWETNARDLLPSRSQRRWRMSGDPAVTNKVIVDNRASSQHTLIEVITRDRPGLLFALSEALHALGLSIAVAKIATEGTRVVDVFYVSEQDNMKVEQVERIELVRSTLLDLLAKMDE